MKCPVCGAAMVPVCDELRCPMCYIDESFRDPPRDRPIPERFVPKFAGYGQKARPHDAARPRACAGSPYGATP